MARVTITTKTAQSPCAYKGKYSDGKLVPLKLGDSAEPKPCAGVNGTTITVEDLFYNMRTRRSAFKNTSEQYQRILDVVTRYAIHYGDSHIAFTCRKQGQAIPDIHTPSSTSSTLDNIKIAYGSTLTRELIGCEFYFIFDEGDEKHDVSVGSSKNKCFNVKEGGSALQCSVKGYVTNANYSTKRSTFIFFINHRLVECPPIKKMLESFYAEILPKCGYPFVYLSIEVPPQIVDVNIHPTKKEVCFLYEDQLLQQIYGQMKSLLSSANESRSFATQSLISVRDDPPTESSSVASIYADTKMNQELKTDCKSEDVVNNDIDNDISASIALYSSSSTEICDELQKSEMELSQFSDHNNEMAILESAIAPKKRRAAEIESSTELFDKSVSYFVSRGSTRAATQAPNKLIRTDPLIARIDQFFPTAPATKRNLSDVGDSDICVESKNNRFSTSGPRSGLRYDELESDDSSAVTEPNKKRLKKKSNIALCLPIGSCLCCAPDSSDKSNFINNGSVIDIGSKNADTSAPSMTLRLQPIKETSCQYISIMELVVEIQASFHSGVDSMLKKLTYVGVINSAYMLGQVIKSSNNFTIYTYNTIYFI